MISRKHRKFSLSEVVDNFCRRSMFRKGLNGESVRSERYLWEGLYIITKIKGEI